MDGVSVKMVVQVLAVIGTVLILGRWFRTVQIENRKKQIPLYKDYISTPAIVIWAVLAALIIFRWYIMANGGHL